MGCPRLLEGSAGLRSSVDQRQQRGIGGRQHVGAVACNGAEAVEIAQDAPTLCDRCRLVLAQQTGGIQRATGTVVGAAAGGFRNIQTAERERPESHHLPAARRNPWRMDGLI